MPNFFAHYLHGQNVMPLLPRKIRKGITSKKLFELGLQGPDIFYPYKALSIPNSYKVNKLVGKIHSEPCTKFMKRLFKNTRVTTSGNLFSYVCGFICHFSLDACCHPYINGITKNINFTHGEIEVEFDRLLLQLNGYEPLETNFSKMVSVPALKSPETNAVHSAYAGYDIITSKVVVRTLKDFKFFKKFFYSPSETKQKVLQSVCSALMISKIYNSCVMPSQEKEQAFVSNAGLLVLFNDSIGEAAELIKNFYNCIRHKARLSKKFDRPFV